MHKSSLAVPLLAYRFFLLLLFGSFPICLYSQSGTAPGYIVTNTNDTIHGQLKFRKAVSSVTFYTENRSNPQSYTPGQIKGFSFSEGKLYRTASVPVSGGEQQLVFANALVSGGSSLLKLGNNYIILANDTSYYLSQEADGAMKSAAAQAVRNRKNLGVINYLLSNCSYPEKDIFNKSISPKSLTDFIIAHNKCLGKEFVVHNEQKPWSKLQLGFSAGTSLSSISFVNERYKENILINATFDPVLSPRIGLSFIASSPRINERIAFQGDIILEKSLHQTVKAFPEEDTKYDIFADMISIQVPLTLRYTLNKGTNQAFWRAGVITGSFLRRNLHWVKEEEISWENDGKAYKLINTSLGSSPESITNQFSYMLAIGASKPVFRQTQGYVELSFNKSIIPNVPSQEPKLNNTQLNIVFGILY